MSPIAAGSAIGVAALTVGRGALNAAASGLSFAAELAKSASGAHEATEQHSAAQKAARAELDQRLEAMRQRITRHLAECGLDLAEPVELVSDGLGGIDLAGSHPQAAALKEALGRDVLLERDFNQLLNDASETLPPAEAIISITIAKDQGMPRKD